MMNPEPDPRKPITITTLDKAMMTAELLTVPQVCRRIPGARGNEGVSPSTITRWILSGCPARNGTRVRLAATRAGSRWLIRAADLDAFFAALAATDPSPPPPPTRSDTQRLAASARAAAELKRRGA